MNTTTSLLRHGCTVLTNERHIVIFAQWSQRFEKKNVTGSLLRYGCNVLKNERHIVIVAL